MRKTTETRFQDPVLGVVAVRRSSRARRIILRINPAREVVLTLPLRASLDDGLRFLQSRRDWILAAKQRVPERVALPPEEVARLRKEAADWLPARLEALAARHGFHYKQLRLKYNHSNWGSCSARGNINLNICLMAVPESLRDYVLLHELCHLQYLNHGAAFHALLESCCPDHLRLQKELRAYAGLLAK